MVRPTGFEPAAYRVGVIRPSKKKPRFYAGFRYIPQIRHPNMKTVEALGTPGLPQFFRFWGNSSQTVVRGRAERKKATNTEPYLISGSPDTTLHQQYPAVSEKFSSTHSPH